MANSMKDTRQRGRYYVAGNPALTSKAVIIDRSGTGHRMFQFSNDPHCERKLGEICLQTKTRS